MGSGPHGARSQTRRTTRPAAGAPSSGLRSSPKHHRDPSPWPREPPAWPSTHINPSQQHTHRAAPHPANLRAPIPPITASGQSPPAPPRPSPHASSGQSSCAPPLEAEGPRSHASGCPDNVPPPPVDFLRMRVFAARLHSVSTLGIMGRFEPLNPGHVTLPWLW